MAIALGLVSTLLWVPQVKEVKKEKTKFMSPLRKLRSDAPRTLRKTTP